MLIPIGSHYDVSIVIDDSTFICNGRTFRQKRNLGDSTVLTLIDINILSTDCCQVICGQCKLLIRLITIDPRPLFAYGWYGGLSPVRITFIANFEVCASLGYCCIHTKHITSLESADGLAVDFYAIRIGAFPQGSLSRSNWHGCNGKEHDEK